MKSRVTVTLALCLLFALGATAPAMAAVKTLSVNCFTTDNPHPYPSDAYCTQVGTDDYQVGTHQGVSAGVNTVTNVGAKPLTSFTALRYKPVGPVLTTNNLCLPSAECFNITSPFLEIPVDLDGDQRGSGAQDDHVYIPAHSCTNAQGVVDVTNDLTCTVYANGGPYVNWSAYLNANPTAAVSRNSGAPWIEVNHAYGEGDWTLQDVKFTTG